MRAASTVVDVAICLLLVSASALTVAHAPAEPHHRENAAGDVATTLAASTAAVEYGLETDRAPRRTVHGTIASLLATAAVTNAAADGRRLIATGTGFRDGVRAATRNATHRTDERVQVIAGWRPYPGAHLEGRVVVGPSPPPNADVSAATMPVPSGLATPGSRAIDAAKAGGFEAVARLCAESIVDGLAPPDETRLALAANDDAAALADRRYRQLALVYDLPADGVDAAEDERTARRALVRAMTARIDAELRTEFETPTDAAREIAVGRVRITVRTWSP